MTVKELKRNLERYSDDAEVLISSASDIYRYNIRSVFLSYKDVILTMKRLPKPEEGKECPSKKQ